MLKKVRLGETRAKSFAGGQGDIRLMDETCIEGGIP